jgi:anti-sigma28 factor (negative regulator of flagellin synthesis)
VKINIYTDQYLPPAASKTPAPAPSPAAATLADQLSATPGGTNVNSALDKLSGSRAARVAQLTTLYASGRYNVDSNLVAQALVSGAIA